MGHYEDGYDRGRDGKGSAHNPANIIGDLLEPLFGIDHEEVLKEEQRGFEDGLRDRAREEYEKDHKG